LAGCFPRRSPGDGAGSSRVSTVRRLATTLTGAPSETGTMQANHWTNGPGLEGILADRLIRPTWPSLTSAAIPCRVVWLTTRTDTNQGWSVRKDLCAYVTVAVPDDEIVPWNKYRQELPYGTVSGLETSARSWGQGDPQTWFIVRRGIAESEWLEVVDLRRAS
jgi:hypothetical protein